MKPNFFIVLHLLAPYKSYPNTEINKKCCLFFKKSRLVMGQLCPNLYRTERATYVGISAHYIFYISIISWTYIYLAYLQPGIKKKRLIRNHYNIIQYWFKFQYSFSNPLMMSQWLRCTHIYRLTVTCSYPLVQYTAPTGMSLASKRRSYAWRDL